MTSIPALRKLTNSLRFRAAKLRKGTVRYYCGDLPALYNALDAAGIHPVVLRWADDVPLSPELEQSCPHDVDHLIHDDVAARIGHIAAKFPGPVKCDFYSVSGQSGSAYKAYPYYPPVLALKILETAIKDARGFWRPTPDAEYHAFAYHLCYHKGHRSGLPDGFSPDAQISPASRDYASELRRLAQVCDAPVPEPLTLAALHDRLREMGWSMPDDLVTRWPDQHPFLPLLAQHNAQSLQGDTTLARDLTVFVLRADCDTEALIRMARDGIQTRFTILDEIALSPEQQAALMAQTRGGNWIEKYCKAPVPPTRLLICKNAQTPGPLPKGMSPDKIQQRYPHVTNTDVLIKREIRKQLNSTHDEASQRVLIHASDNAEEAALMLRSVFGIRLQDRLNTLLS